MRISKTQKYKNSRLSVSEHKVQFQENKPSIYPVIEYPGDSVTVAVFNEAGEILLCREYKYAIDQHIYTLPSGFIDDGEEKEDAAQRELIEETGCLVNNIETIASTHPIPANSKLCQYILTAELTGTGPRAPEAGEVSMTQVWMDFDAAVELAMNGEVKHSPSLLALLKLASLRK